MSARRPPYAFEVLVKTFLRPHKVQRLVESIQEHYPGVTIRVADDSPDSASRRTLLADLLARGCHVYRLAPHSGISVGRNHLVRAVETPFFVLTDDDKVFDHRTVLERLQAVLAADADAVIAAGMNLDYGRLLRFQHGRLERDGLTLRRHLFGELAPAMTVGGVRCIPCDVTPNFFMARTSLFRRRSVAWDERFKVGHGEHVWFFASLPRDLHVYSVPEVRISHFPTRWGDRAYRTFRYDAGELERFTEVTGIRVETVWEYEGPWRSRRRRLEGWLRRTADRFVAGK